MRTLPHSPARNISRLPAALQVCGAELFTGSTAIVTAAYYEVRHIIGIQSQLRSCLSNYCGASPSSSSRVAVLLCQHKLAELASQPPINPTPAAPTAPLSYQPRSAPAPPLQGKVSLRQLGRQWAGSYAGNALGCALGVALLLGSGVVYGLMPGVSAVSLAKISYPLHQTFVSDGMRPPPGGAPGAGGSWEAVV